MSNQLVAKEKLASRREMYNFLERINVPFGVRIPKGTLKKVRNEIDTLRVESGEYLAVE